MKTIILVSFKNSPMRAFNNKAAAIEWIKKICEQYELNMLDYKIQDILLND